MSLIWTSDIEKIIPYCSLSSSSSSPQTPSVWRGSHTCYQRQRLGFERETCICFGSMLAIFTEAEHFYVQGGHIQPTILGIFRGWKCENHPKLRWLFLPRRSPVMATKDVVIIGPDNWNDLVLRGWQIRQTSRSRRLVLTPSIHSENRNFGHKRLANLQGDLDAGTML